MTAEMRIHRTARMRIVARPGIIAGIPKHARTHRIELDGATAHEKIGLRCQSAPRDSALPSRFVDTSH
jgi:hypothetical protein